MRLAHLAQNACDTLALRLQQPECTAERGQESSSLRASVSLGLETSVCTQATFIKDKEQMVMLLVHMGICKLQ